MASPEQVQILKTLLASLSSADKNTLANLTARDLAETVNDLIGTERAVKMKAALNAVSKGTISNWGVILQASNSADAATVMSDIADFEAAAQAQNGDTLFAAALALGFSARKAYGR